MEKNSAKKYDQRIKKKKIKKVKVYSFLVLIIPIKDNIANKANIGIGIPIFYSCRNCCWIFISLMT
jgi:hypothetical protein